MKKLFITLVFLIVSFFAFAQQISDSCTTNYYVQIGHNIANMVISCDRPTTLEFNIYSKDSIHIAKFFYLVEVNEKHVQLSLAAFKPDTYIVSVYDGQNTVQFKLDNFSENP